MSPRRWIDRVSDILDACHEILDMVQAMDYLAFSADLKTIRAVELNFIIMGEAASAIPEFIQESHPEIPWHQMRGVRNRLVHAYYEVSPAILWQTVTVDIPLMIPALKRLLQES